MGIEINQVCEYCYITSIHLEKHPTEEGGQQLVLEIHYQRQTPERVMIDWGSKSIVVKVADKITDQDMLDAMKDIEEIKNNLKSEVAGYKC